MRSVSLSLSLFLAGCAASSTTGPAQPRPAPAGAAWHTGGPVTPEEKQVADFLLASEAFPNLTWIEWGPHDLDQRTSWVEDPTYKKIRVRFRFKAKDSPPGVIDHVYELREGEKPMGVGNTIGTAEDGRAWITAALARKKLQTPQ